MRRAAGPDLETVAYRETYRDPQKDGPGQEAALLFRYAAISRSDPDGDEADAIRDRILAACAEKHAAKLLG